MRRHSLLAHLTMGVVVLGVLAAAGCGSSTQTDSSGEPAGAQPVATPSAAESSPTDPAATSYDTTPRPASLFDQLPGVVR